MATPNNPRNKKKKLQWRYMDSDGAWHTSFLAKEENPFDLAEAYFLNATAIAAVRSSNVSDKTLALAYARALLRPPVQE